MRIIATRDSREGFIYFLGNFRLEYILRNIYKGVYTLLEMGLKEDMDEILGPIESEAGVKAKLEISEEEKSEDLEDEEDIEEDVLEDEDVDD